MLYRLILFLVGGVFFIIAMIWIGLQAAEMYSRSSMDGVVGLLLGLGLLGAMLIFLARWLANVLQDRQLLAERASRAEQQTADGQKRLEAVFRSRRQLVEASNESEVVQGVLGMAVEFTEALGASYVPLDERGQPLPAIHVSQDGPVVPNAWVEYLATPAVRDRCKACEKHAHFSTTCPLLKGPFAENLGLYCLPLRRGEREYGVLNIYYPVDNNLNPETRAFLQSIVDEAGLALEGIWLRKRELSALRHLQSVRQKTDISALFASMLENVYQTLEVDFAVLVLQSPQRGAGEAQEPAIEMRLEQGDLPEQARPIVQGVIQGVCASGEALLMNTLSGDSPSPSGARSIMAASLMDSAHKPVGVLLVGSRRSNSFSQRQLTLLQSVAAQMALVMESTQQLAELEYNAMLEERTRLAREIHDGLAQTLGFLKLQAAQMQGYLDRGDLERLQQGLQTYYQVLSEAYNDARYAIDGLRISPSGDSLTGWLEQTLEDFREHVRPQNLFVELTCLDVQTQLPPEVQAQLIRILQEALNNIRKHAQAQHAWVSCCENGYDLVLEIRDDGQGFSFEDISGPSQHGLRGMHERAELMRADFQIINPPEGGTLVRVSLPLKTGEKLP